MDNKYIVFKKDEFDLAVAAWIDSEGGNSLPEPVADATVIRGQDLAAPLILDAYASHYAALAEMLTKYDLTTEAAQALTASDYFHERATESYQMERKLPD